MTDQINEHLDALEQLLIKQADDAGEGPRTMTKSRFASEMERASFITAYGQASYDNLRE